MRDEDHPLADLAFSALESGSAIVPAIWWYEIRNILVLNERRERISADDVVGFLSEMEQLNIEIATQGDSALVLDLARRDALTVYDAAYLALAQRKQLPLATLDKALEAAAIAEGVALLS
jgi:predicted nucleic acid-binding protein